jgi:chromosome segregation ATPase
VRRTLAKVEIDPSIDRILAALGEEVERVFTPTGQVRKGGELFQLQEQVQKLDVELTEARRKLRALEDQQAAYQNLSLEVEQSRQFAETSRAEAERLSALLRELDRARIEVNSAQQGYDQANAQLQSVDQDVGKLARLQSDLGNAGPQLESARQELEQSARSELGVQQQIRDEGQQSAGLEKDHESAGKSVARLRTLLKWRELQNEVFAGKAKLERISALSAERSGKEEQRARLPKVTLKQLENLRALERELRDVQIQLQAAGLKVELHPLRPGKLLAENEEGAREVEASPSTPLHGRRRIRLELPDWGGITITSGAQELQTLEAQLKDKTERWADSNEKLGVAGADEAEQVFQTGKDLERDLKTIEKQLNALLDEHESEQNFRHALTANEAKLTALVVQLDPLSPQESEAALSELDGCLTDAETTHAALGRRVQEASARLHDLREQLNALLRRRGETQAQAAKAQGDIERFQSQIRTMQERYAGGLEKARAAVQQAFVQAEARLIVAKGKLPLEADLLPARRERTLRAAAEAEQTHQSKRAEMNRLEGSLGNASAAGLYTQSAETEESLGALQGRANAIRNRAQAARLLVALIARRKTAAVRTVLGPLEQRLSASFAELTGDRHRSVFLDENLAVLGTGRSRDARELILFDNLSQGAKEQLLLALRAAVALELSHSEPQLLILDDVLVNTDGIRQTRVLDFLTTLAQQVQILVLTCHPERYAGVGQRLSISEPV